MQVLTTKVFEALVGCVCTFATRTSTAAGWATKMAAPTARFGGLSSDNAITVGCCFNSILKDTPNFL